MNRLDNFMLILVLRAAMVALMAIAAGCATERMQGPRYEIDRPVVVDLPDGSFRIDREQESFDAGEARGKGAREMQFGGIRKTPAGGVVIAGSSVEIPEPPADISPMFWIGGGLMAASVIAYYVSGLGLAVACLVGGGVIVAWAKFVDSYPWAPWIVVGLVVAYALIEMYGWRASARTSARAVEAAGVEAARRVKRQAEHISNGSLLSKVFTRRAKR